jgi:acylphosphatase
MAQRPRDPLRSAGRNDGVSSAPPSLECWHVRVTGRVQGVGYRESCVRVARALGVRGWVRNRVDGSVEALVQGPADALAQLRAWMLAGPPLARVDGLEVSLQTVPHEPLGRFERRPTV